MNTEIILKKFVLKYTPTATEVIIQTWNFLEDRTRAVLQYCFSLMSDDLEEWLKVLCNSKRTFFKPPILKMNGEEDKDLSRRVEFRVRTNAEKQLEDIANKRFIHKQ